MLQTVKKKLKNYLLPQNPDLYYGELNGSFNYWRIFLWNLRHPGRSFNRFRYGQLFKLNSYRKASFKKEISEMKKNNINSDNYSNDEILDKFDELLNTGGVVIDGYFSESKIDNFLNKYNSVIKRIKDFDPPPPGGGVNQENLVLYDELVTLWLDPHIIQMISSFHNKTSLARHYPNLQYTVMKEKLSSRDIHERKIKTNGACWWHADHSVLFNMHILLDDLTEEDAHMQYIPGSNKYLNSSSNFSDEVVNELDIKPIKCIGKKGTVYLHEANTVHKLNLEKSKNNRLALHLEFSAGSNILIDCNTISKCLSSGFDLNKLNKSQRNTLKGIFPKSLQKGYEISSSEVISPTRFKGI